MKGRKGHSEGRDIRKEGTLSVYRYIDIYIYTYIYTHKHIHTRTCVYIYVCKEGRKVTEGREGGKKVGR